MDEAKANLPAPQAHFLSELRAAEEAVRIAPNSLAIQQILNRRDGQLAETSLVDEWAGTVLGIQNVNGKAGISVEFAGAMALAGVHINYGLDTLISADDSEIYQEILSLRRGDKVSFSGEFEIFEGSLVEMSYSETRTVSTPEFLFKFASIRSHNN